MNIARLRKIYESQCQEYKTSFYSGLREYAEYLDRFLHSKEVVDGMSFADRADKLPTTYIDFFREYE